VGVASFYVDVPPLNVQQRLDLKALFQKLAVTTQNGKESEAAAQFLQKLLALAESAGGEAPRPEAPTTKDVRDLQMLSGNAQLLKLHEQKDAVTANLTAWKKSADAIAKRWPAWERLLEFQAFAGNLPEGESSAASIAAITRGRSLLADPDPVPDLTKRLATALRLALGKLQEDLSAAFATGHERLQASQTWNRLCENPPAGAAPRPDLAAPAAEPFGTDDEILAALRLKTLADRSNLLDAVPQRFVRALEEASRLLEPKAVKINLPAATIKNTDDLNAWFADVRTQVEQQLKTGPVIL
jgi:hypothetical protein